MQDIFIEYMVKKRKSPIHLILSVLLIIVALAIAFFAIFFSGALGALSILGPAVAIGVVYGAYQVISSMNVEYEYLITNGEMDIDQIIAQRKRKRLITVNMRNVEAFNRYNPENLVDKNPQHKIIACDSLASDDLWCLTTHHKEKGLTLVVFNASERMLEGIRPFLPRTIMQEVFVRKQF